MAEVRGLGADLIEKLQVNRYTGLVGDGQQVQNGIGGAAQRHIAGQRIADGALVDDLAGGDALLYHIHDGHTGVLCQQQALGVDGGDGAVAGQCDADGLAQAVHAVGSVHTGTGTAGRTCFVLTLSQAFLCKLACCVSTNSLKHAGKTCLVSV